MENSTFRTSNPYEAQFGYHRAVRRGPFIFVSGTTSINAAPLDETTPQLDSVVTKEQDHPHTLEPEVLHQSSAYLQSLQIFSEITRAVEALGGTRSDIVRVRMFVKDEHDGDEVGRALKEFIGEEVSLAATMIFGAGFVKEGMKVEIEADAVVL